MSLSLGTAAPDDLWLWWSAYFRSDGDRPPIKPAGLGRIARRLPSRHAGHWLRTVQPEQKRLTRFGPEAGDIAGTGTNCPFRFGGEKCGCGPPGEAPGNPGEAPRQPQRCSDTCSSTKFRPISAPQGPVQCPTGQARIAQYLPTAHSSAGGDGGGEWPHQGTLHFSGQSTAGSKIDRALHARRSPPENTRHRALIPVPVIRRCQHAPF